MERSLKQFIYGVFYLSVFALIIWGGYIFFSPTASCFDGVRNQGEEGIDCGGSCLTCDVMTLSPIKILGRPDVFKGPGNISLLVKIVNPNPDHGAEFSYSFIIYDESGKVENTFSGSGFINASERKYINENKFFQSTSFNRAVLRISEVEWLKQEKSLKPKLEVKDVSTFIENDKVSVRGLIDNQSLFSGFDVEVVAIFVDEYGFNIFAGRTIIKNIEGFAREKFNITVPITSDIAEKISSDRTEMYLSVR